MEIENDAKFLENICYYFQKSSIFCSFFRVIMAHTTHIFSFFSGRIFLPKLGKTIAIFSLVKK